MQKSKKILCDVNFKSGHTLFDGRHIGTKSNYLLIFVKDGKICTVSNIKYQRDEKTTVDMTEQIQNFSVYQKKKGMIPVITFFDGHKEKLTNEEFAIVSYYEYGVREDEIHDDNALLCFSIKAANGKVYLKCLENDKDCIAIALLNVLISSFVEA